MSETFAVSVLTWQHGSIESVRYHERFYETTKVDHAISVSLKPLHKFPELAPLVEKLIELRPLDEVDESNLCELVEGFPRLLLAVEKQKPSSHRGLYERTSTSRRLKTH
jgi:hypothetical protein